MKNNWYVLTGGPSSGKTTTLAALEKEKYKVIYEAARFLIDEEMKKGKTLEEIRKDELSFQKKVLDIKLDWEKLLNKNKLVFLERGIPDSIAYYQKCGIFNDLKLKKAIDNCFYKKVFLLEMMEYEKDYARTETLEEAKELEKLLEKGYKDLDIEVIRVPPMSVNKRVKFILDNL